MFKTVKPLAAVTLALIAGAASAASAVTIGFDNLGSAKVGSYKENKYLVVSSKAKDLTAGPAANPELQSSSFEFVAAPNNPDVVFDLDSFFLDFGAASDVKLTYITASTKIGSIDLGDTSSGLFKISKKGVYTFTNAIDDIVYFELDGTSVNSRGKQVAAEFDTDNIKVTAVPEPSSLALMFAGLGMFATLVRRRRM